MSDRRTCHTSNQRKQSTSVFDAVDGSSTGTSVPWMWVLLRLPTISEERAMQTIRRKIRHSSYSGGPDNNSNNFRNKISEHSCPIRSR